MILLRLFILTFIIVTPSLYADARIDNDDDFFAEISRRNLHDTDASYIVVQQAAAPIADIHADSGEAGYIIYQFTADVLETLKGPALGQVQYTVGYEASIQARTDPSQPLLVSLCYNDDGALYIPGNGYRFAMTDEQRQALRDQPTGPDKGRDCHSPDTP